MQESSSENSECKERMSLPQVPHESPCSPASSPLQDEYTELLQCTSASLRMENERRSPASNLNTSLICHCREKSEIPESKDRNAKPEVELISSLGPVAHATVEFAAASMETKLDGWLKTLKENIMTELSSSIVASLESQRQEQCKESNKLVGERVCLEKEVNLLSEIINSMEQSTSRKDTLIDNLTESLATQKGKTLMAFKFYNWKTSHLDKLREKFTEKLAVQFHEAKLSQKVLKGWFGLIQGRWRSRVEHKCQGQAQNVCLQLSNDYESKINSLNETIKSLEDRVSTLQVEKETYADQVKKAFMRGVCALNMEAMSAFNQEQADTSCIGMSPPYDTSQSLDLAGNNGNANLDFVHPCKTHGVSKSLPPELIVSSSSTDLLISSKSESIPCPPTSLPIVQTMVSTKGRPKQCAPGKTKMTPSSSKSKLHLLGQVLSPPMASVVVERHHPVTKQTMGKATAVCYPKQSLRDSGQQPAPRLARGVQVIAAGPQPLSSDHHYKRLAGQTGCHHTVNTHSSPIRVVE